MIPLRHITSEPSRHHDDRHRTRKYLRDRANQGDRVRTGSIWILSGHQDFRTRPRGRIAAEKQRAASRAHLPIRVTHAYLALLGYPREAARGTEVIIETGPAP